MDFEYGCATVNKFAFLDENEVDDPSDLLAKVDLAREQAAKKDVKKVDAKGKKIDPKKAATTAAKDNKKPLQASDNAVKKTDSKDTGKKFSSDRRPAGGAGGDLKENRGPRTDRPDRPFRPQGDRPPRQEGDRPPRQEGDRPPRQEGDRQVRRPQGDRPYQDRPPRQPRTDADGNVIEQQEGEGFRGGYRGGNGGRGGQFGGRGGGGYNSRGPRRDEVDGEPRRFDRHSGSEKTGIKAVDKKDGAGKGNWGTATDEVVIEDALKEGEVAADGTVTAAATTGNKDWAERVDENEEKEPEEETPNFMTLEEYKALKSQVNKKNDFNIRKPGEGEDQSKWGKTYLLPKKPDSDEEDEEEESEESEVEDDAEEVARKELIKTMQSNFKFESTNVSSDRGRGDRGGRGGRGGDRGGRGDRGDRPQYGERREGGDRPYGERRERKPEAATTDESATVATDSAAATDAPVLGDVQASPSERKGFGERRPQGDRPQGDRPQRGGASGGARGGRGGQSRGGSQQQGGRSGPSAAKFSAPKFDDEKDFPTLGK